MKMHTITHPHSPSPSPTPSNIRGVVWYQRSSSHLGDQSVAPWAAPPGAGRQGGWGLGGWGGGGWELGGRGRDGRGRGLYGRNVRGQYDEMDRWVLNKWKNVIQEREERVGHVRHT